MQELASQVQRLNQQLADAQKDIQSQDERMDELFAAQKDNDTVIMQYQSSMHAADEKFSRKAQELSM